jgi:hypothetical protein
MCRSHSRRRETRYVLVCITILFLVVGAVGGAIATAPRTQQETGTATAALAPDRGSTPVHQVDNRTLTLTNASIVGSEVIETTGKTTYVWESPRYNLSVNVTSSGYDDSHYVDVCVEVRGQSAGNNSSTAPPNCRVLAPRVNDTSGFRIPYEGLTVGQQTVGISARDVEANVTVSRHNLSVTVLRKEGDLDGDRLTNWREVQLGTNFTVADTDGDGLDDGAEVDNYGTNPLSKDTDGDSLLDAQEVSMATNATNPDTDGDGLDDGYEWNNERTSPTDPDTDGDGLDDGTEVNVYETDPTDVDSDGDGLSDQTEVRLGTNPRNPLTVFLALFGLALLAVVAAFVVVRLFGGRIRDSLVDRSPTLARLDAALDGPTDGGRVDEPEGTTRNAVDGGEPGSVADDGGEPSFDLDVQTDEDRVLNILYEHGGRIRQRELAEQTEWSDSKVSRLLSGMEEDGHLNKVRIGRENVIVLDDEDDEAPP